MIGVILIFLILTVQPLFFVSKFEQRFEIGLPICCMLDTFVLLVCGMLFHNLIIGVILVACLSGASLVYTVVAEKTNLCGFAAKFATPGFWAWCVGYILMWAFSAMIFLIEFDDFMHWGPMVKQMFYYDRLYTDPDIQISIHKNYPAVVQLFEYFFCKLCGHYNETIIFAAKRVLMFACVLPITQFFKKGEALKAILAAVVGWLLISIFDEPAKAYMKLIGTDDVLGVVFGVYLLYVVFGKNSKLKLFNCTVISIFLTQVKITGIFLSLIGMGLHALIVILERIKERKILRHIPTTLFYVAVWSLPIFVFYIWTKYVSGIADVGGDAALIQPQEWLKWLTLQGGWDKNEVIQIFIKNWLTSPLGTGGIELNRLQLVVIFFMFCMVWQKYSTDTATRKRIISLGFILPIGIVAYSISMLLIFWLPINYKMNNAFYGSLPRYMVCCFIAILFLMYVVAIKYTAVESCEWPLRRDVIAGVTYSIAFLLIPSWLYLALTPARVDLGYYSGYKYKRNISEKVQNYVSKDDLLYIVGRSANNDYVIHKYYLIPLNGNDNFLYDKSESYTPQEVYNAPADWSEILIDRGFGYVWLTTIDDKFCEKFASMFSAPLEQITDFTLWKVTLTGEAELPVLLEPINIES